MYITPAGVFVGRGHVGEKKQVFDSQKEYARYLVLRSWQDAGLISILKPHRVFALHAPDGTKITTYEADFTYVLGGRLIVEDVKSTKKKGKSFGTVDTRMYQLKKRWMLAEYGITIIEV